ncbi:MAG: protein kinase [Duncaniella sp.]|nr:protein kinase [Duncaniella sp.]
MIFDSSPSDFSSDFSDKSPDSSVIFTDDNICGEGASCVVYRMRIGGLRLAVKRLRPEYRSRPEYIASYRKEFNLGQQLKHDGIPVYRDFRADNQDVFIGMDYIDGLTLDEFIDTATGQDYFRDTDNTVRFLTQLINVVAYLHRSGVIHCDIKPANIMIRHSDLGVMLIDLDKSYCDTIDSTHGGTAGHSAPLNDGELPTASKDFAAIGNIVSYLADHVKRFPYSRFKRFQKACHDRQANSDSLLKALQHRSLTGLLIFATLFICLAVIALYLAFKPSASLTPLESDSLIKNSPEAADSVSTEINASSIPKQKAEMTFDFDKLMEPFNREADEAFASLATGSLGDNEIQELMYKIINSYLDSYHAIVAEFKNENPAMSDIEVQLAVADRSQSSRATRLYEQFVQACADTIKMRHPESYDDLD